MAGYATGAPELQQAAKDIEQVNSETQGILSSLQSQLAPLESAWQGDAARAFHQLIERFQEDAKKLNDALRSIQEQMTGTAATYVQQEEEHKNTMSSLLNRLQG